MAYHKHHTSLMIWLVVLLPVLFLVTLTIGRISISATEIGRILTSLVLSQPIDPDLSNKAMVLTFVRLPRCLLAVLLGMGISVSGAVYQGLFRNPLVSPDILGVSAGATFGAALGLLLPGNSFALVQVLAFAFGLAAVMMALGIARVIAVNPILVLVLAGLVVLSVFNSSITLLKSFADPYNELPAIVFWIMGSISRAEWQDLHTVAPLIGCGLFIIFILRYKLNVLSLGDLQSKSIGIHPGMYRFVFIALSSAMVAASVSTCGQVCWAGLVIPHIARTLVGPNHEVMIPVTTLLGGMFLLIADTLARTLTSAELPISVVTAFIGAPVFAYLLYHNRGSGWS